ncbi:pectin lyase fold/virulence factor [Xylaria palmicola]|nr:pectin lyase fold/virulence factor [Xylaria palmicola]
MHFTRLLSILPLTSCASAAGLVGTAYGFTKGATPIGTTVTPTNNAQLSSFLADSTPRVISCDPNETRITATYNPEATSGLTGLRIAGGSKNVIVQNIRITTLNPQYVWGGDGISIEGADGVWIDHVTFDNIGRMFIVSHYTANRITTSYNYYNGATSYSNSCDGQQYRGTMFIGEGDKVTIDHNYYFKMSGRSPKLGIKGSDAYFHATNNYFLTSSGHSFHIVANTYALLEGNAFSSAKTPITIDSTASGAYIFDSPSSSLSICSSYLDRSCIVNSVSSSGTLPSQANTAALSKLSGSYKSYLITPESAYLTMTNVIAKAGQGKV